ncbi:MAG: dTMP kinase [Candidatus Micrarchaeota archaeon]
MKGIFIVVEGIDGSGKGYMMMRLQEYITGRSKKYDHVLLTREPTNSNIGQKMREILVKESDPTTGARKCLDLYVSDRKQHLENHILPALEKGYVVLCDRYKYSTMAFQAAQGLPLEELIELQKDFRTPDLTLILDLPTRQAIARIRYRDWQGSNEKFEDPTFMEKVRMNYLTIAHQLKDPIEIINAGVEKVEMFNQVKAAIEKRGILPY